MGCILNIYIHNAAVKDSEYIDLYIGVAMTAQWSLVEIVLADSASVGRSIARGRIIPEADILHKIWQFNVVILNLF